MMVFGIIITILLSYLLGNLNAASIIGRLAFKEDIRNIGSGSAGATNAFRNFGTGWGILVMVIDALKGYAAYFVGYAIGNLVGTTVVAAQWIGMLAGVFVVVGHIWPVLYRFRGGKGVATTFGVVLAAHPVIALVAFAVAILGAVITNHMSIGSLASAVYAWIGCLIVGPAASRVMMTVLMLLIFWQHRGNIDRLINGNENTFMKRSLIDVFRGTGGGSSGGGTTTSGRKLK